MERQTVNVPEAATILGISRNQAYKMVREGVLPVLRFGTRIVIPVAALQELLASAERGAQSKG